MIEELEFDAYAVESSGLMWEETVHQRLYPYQHCSGCSLHRGKREVLRRVIYVLLDAFLVSASTW